jgi:hypothetical protein
LMAQTQSKALFIVEPEHSTPLVEVHESAESVAAQPKTKRSSRFDVITQWRLGQMRKYYQQFLERQQKIISATPSKEGTCAAEKQ